MTMNHWQPRQTIPWRYFRSPDDVSLFEHVYEDIFERPYLPAMWGRIPIEEMAWAPPVEILETENSFIIKSDIPGVKQKEIEVSVTGNTLTIKGERKSDSETAGQSYYCCERMYGRFSRSITLPANMDASNIEASYDDGVLEISLPKSVEAKPKKVPVAARRKAS